VNLLKLRKMGKMVNLEMYNNEVELICNELGINQKKLAELIGVSQNTVSSWKNEKLGLPNWTKNVFQLLRERQECLEFKKVFSKLQLAK